MVLVATGSLQSQAYTLSQVEIHNADTKVGSSSTYMFTERAHTLLLFVIDNIVFVFDITLFVTAVRSGLDECIVFFKEFCSFLLDIVALCICY